MNMKRIFAAVLALVLSAGLSAPAFADGLPEGWTPADGARDMLLIAPNPNAVSENYNGVVSLNGIDIPSVTYSIPVAGSWETVDNVIPIGELPGAPAGYVPMRLLCQATDGGAAYWYEEENRSMFFLNEAIIYTDFNDDSVYILDENREMVLQEGVSCYLRRGVTFLPASFLSTLPGVTVDSYTDAGKEYFDVTIEIPGTPLQKLALSIHNAMEMPSGAEPADWFALMEIDTSAFEELAGQIPLMNISSDSVLIGKYAAGADKEAGKAALKAYQDQQINNFTNYLPGPLAVAQNGQIVESADGKYVMLILSKDNDKAIQLFREGIVRVDAEMTGIQPR